MPLRVAPAEAHDGPKARNPSALDPILVPIVSPILTHSASVPTRHTLNPEPKAVKQDERNLQVGSNLQMQATESQLLDVVHRVGVNKLESSIRMASLDWSCKGEIGVL